LSADTSVRSASTCCCACRTAFWSPVNPRNNAVNLDDEDDEDDEDEPEPTADGAVDWAEDDDTDVWLAWSDASFACACATVDWSELTVVAMPVVFNWANVCPTPTDCPTATFTADTRPDIGNATVADDTGCTVPIADSESTTVAGPAVAVR
jgi:hypothetical protein